MGKTGLIINTVMCTGLIFVSFMVLVANAVSGANIPNFWGLLIIYSGLIYPAFPVISLIGSWTAFALNSPKASIFFVALPWVYTLYVIALMTIYFTMISKF